jgi:hypothetical protein
MDGKPLAPDIVSLSDHEGARSVFQLERVVVIDVQPR